MENGTLLRINEDITQASSGETAAVAQMPSSSSVKPTTISKQFYVQSAVAVIGFLGATMVGVNQYYDHTESSSALHSLTHKTAEAGFNDPVIGALLLLGGAAFAMSAYKAYRFEVKGNLRSHALSVIAEVIGALAFTSLCVYALVAGNLSVEDAMPVLSNDMIDSGDSRRDKCIYFASYKVVLILAASLLGICTRSLPSAIKSLCLLSKNEKLVSEKEKLESEYERRKSETEQLKSENERLKSETEKHESVIPNNS